MDFSKDDFMVLDVENQKASLPLSRERDKDKNRSNSMVVSVVSTPDSHPVTLNGFGLNPRNSTPSNNIDDASTSLLRRVNQVNQASNQPSTSNHAKGPSEQRSLQSSRKSHPPSDQESSDDLALDTMPHHHYKLAAATLSTGLCYDVRMRYHCELDPPKQRLDFHPEDPRRIYSIYKELCLAGLVDDQMSTRPIVSRPLQRVSARNATQAEICLVHDTKHFNFIERTKGNW